MERVWPDPLAGVESYSEEMTVSQVVLFFQRRGMAFTKTMIQNYVRVGLLAPPCQKRFYGRSHLMALVMIYSLKDVLSLEQIKALFALAGSEPEQMPRLYAAFARLSQEAGNVLENLEKISSEDGLHTALLMALISLAAKNTALASIEMV